MKHLPFFIFLLFLCSCSSGLIKEQVELIAIKTLSQTYPSTEKFTYEITFSSEDNTWDVYVYPPKGDAKYNNSSYKIVSPPLYMQINQRGNIVSIL